MDIRPRELELAADLVHAWVDLGAITRPLSLDQLAHRRAEALELFERSPLASAIFDSVDTPPHIANRVWREMFASCVPFELTGRVPIATVFATGDAVHLAAHPLQADDRPDFCAATLRPVRGEGSPAAVIVVCRRVTDAVVARRLGVAEHVLVWSGRAADGADYFNARWCAYVGVPRSWQDVVHPDDRARCIDAFREAARQRIATAVEVRLRRADGAMRWHRIGVVVAADGGRWHATAIDIDEARTADAVRTELLARAVAAREDAEQANRLKDQFLAAVSHELRAPMTTLLLWEKVLRDADADPEMRAKAGQAIRESVTTQARLVGDLLDVARAISGKLYIDLRPVAIGVIVRDAVQAIAAEALAKGLTVEMRGTNLAHLVDGDRGRLRQILDNLLANALKFTEAGGTVTVTLDRRGGLVVVEIADTGRGVALEFLPRMFEPFSQAEDALTRRGGGLGLGLAISKQLVELHAGTLVATSEGRGHGTTLTIVLPASERSLPTYAVGAPSMARLGDLRIMVVDDDHRVRAALALLLDRAGAVVATAESAAAARIQLQTFTPNLVVCDLAMPDEDGYRFIQALRATGNAVPAIALTAHAMPTDVARALAAGFDVHLAKPIDFEHLVSKIDELLHSPA